jgi:predicted dehydrogenase
MAKINWGIIGCGNVTELKSGPAFNKADNSKLVAVMRRDAEKAADYALRHQVEKWYSDADLLMNDAEINSVYIATPPSSHLSHALAGLKKGLNVYVEKPVTRNAGEAQQLADAVKQSNSRLTVAHYRRAVPMFLYIKELLNSKVIGDIRTVQIKMWKSSKAEMIAKVADNWRLQPEQSGGGYFHDLAPHQLDLMLYYFGEPLYYNGYSLNQAQTSPADDHVSGYILFNNNIAVNGSWCFNVAESEVKDECEIIGSKGCIRFPFFGNTVYYKNEVEEQTQTFVHPQHIQQPMITKVVNYFANGGPNPCSIEEAVVVMKMIDAFSEKR